MGQSEGISFLILENFRNQWKDFNQKSVDTLGKLIPKLSKKLDQFRDLVITNKGDYTFEDIGWIVQIRLKSLKYSLSQIWSSTQNHGSSTEGYLANDDSAYILNHVPYWPLVI